MKQRYSGNNYMPLWYFLSEKVRAFPSFNFIGMKVTRGSAPIPASFFSRKMERRITKEFGKSETAL